MRRCQWGGGGGGLVYYVLDIILLHCLNNCIFYTLVVQYSKCLALCDNWHNIHYDIMFTVINIIILMFFHLYLSPSI